MKYSTFIVSLYAAAAAAAAATYLDDTDWMLQARHRSLQLNRRGIIRAQHVREQQFKPNQAGKSPKQESTMDERKQQSKSPEPARKPQETRPPLTRNRSNNPRLALEADGPAGMTIVKGSEPADFKRVSSGEYERRTAEHPTKVIGMVRANVSPTNPRDTRPQTLKATAQGQGVSARVMVTQGGTGNIRTESDRGTQVMPIHDGMKAMTVSSRRPRGANVIATATPPGLVSVHAANEPNFGDL
ncbi:MAG: hypothetical protein GOMPHAMPRED_006664 [Gomphillus americanus]|uniref:Secreted protein n=1 Tax=Gomphillus americanus TaxID=1940652 RepID=A0A8H3ITF6_9LECA|nr:MAG: hypothetical protein GOMPHAMPRED_006664 [Gomphillus americanus]